ncbi:MAG: hypothetical protein RLY61_665 [Candidatus Parcubacteria bacterium]|jgi:signal transduction histidine kinase
MFKQARLNLTVWYLLIIMVLSLGFSSLVYSGISNGINRALLIQQKRLEREYRTYGFIVPNNFSRPPLITNETVREIKLHTLLMLFLVNTLIISLAGVIGYLLAGKTLHPIEQMTLKQKTFMSNAAHEIKTPLTVLKTDLEVTLRDKTASSDDLRSSLRCALEEVDSLTSITNNLMLQAKFDAHSGAYVTFTLVDLSKTLLQTVDSLSKLAKQEKVSWALQLDEGLFVKGDKSALTSLFTNIFENAIKYNKQGGSVTLSLTALGSMARIVVQDTGIGIAQEELAHIFEPFYRVDISHSKQKTGGVGLGLAIAREIVTAHNGSITVQSSPEVGTSFTVTLPLSEKTQKGALE